MPKIIYEDNHLLIAEKPQNVPAQADSSKDPDLLSQLKDYIRDRYHKPGNVYLGLVHRLDRPTGGIMVFARTSKAAARLSAQLKTHALHRIYLAIVRGRTPDSGTLRDLLLKDPSANISHVVSAPQGGAKTAVLHFATLARSEENSLVAVRLETGRSHQIRVQMAHAGHPLLHDVKYDAGAEPGLLALWSSVLTLTHPTSKDIMTFTCAPPRSGGWLCFDADCFSEATLLQLEDRLQIDTF